MHTGSYILCICCMASWKVNGHSSLSCIFFITDCRETVIILCVITHNLETSVLNCIAMTIPENTCCTKQGSAHINTWCAPSCADSIASCANVPSANVHFGKSTQMYVHCSAICSAAESVQTMLKNVQTAPAGQSPEKPPLGGGNCLGEFPAKYFCGKVEKMKMQNKNLTLHC